MHMDPTRLNRFCGNYPRSPGRLALMLGTRLFGLYTATFALAYIVAHLLGADVPNELALDFGAALVESQLPLLLVLCSLWLAYHVAYHLRSPGVRQFTATISGWTGTADVEERLLLLSKRLRRLITLKRCYALFPHPPDGVPRAALTPPRHCAVGWTPSVHPALVYQ